MIGSPVLGEGPQVGYVALAIASIVFAVDRIFMVSQTWLHAAKLRGDETTS